MDSLNPFLDTVRKRRNLFIYCEHLALLLVLGFSVLLYLSFLDYFLPLGQSFRFMFWSCACALVVFSAVHAMLAARASAEETIREVQEKNPQLKDHLLNAWQIRNKLASAESLGMSAELSEEFISSVSGRLSREFVNKTADFSMLFRFFTPVAALLLLTAGFLYRDPGIITDNMARFIFPYSSAEFEKYARVFPGNANLPLGTDFNITVSLTGIPSSGNFEPELFIKTGDSGWTRAPMSAGKEGYSSDKIHLIFRLQYYVKWKALKSAGYIVNPVPLPKLGDFRIKYYFPSYTGLGEKEGRIFGDMPLLLGARIEFSATANKPLKSAALFTSYGRKIPLRVTSGDRVSGGLVVEKDGECWFELAGEDGVVDPAPAHYPLYITKDGPPRITVLAPAQDLVAAEDTKLKIVFSARDDFGVSKVEMAYTRKNTEKYPEKTVTAKAYSPAKQEITDEYEWVLAEIPARPGDIITYCLKATDNDTITGPKTANSETFAIEIYNYETEHQKVEDELKEFRGELLNVLGEQISAKEKLDKFMLEQNGKLTHEQQKALNDAQENIKKHTNRTNEALRKTLDKMENDPYTNYQTYQEHKAISESLQQLSDNQMSNTQNQLSAENYQQAKTSMEETIKDLEKMNLLAEDVLQYQKMEDLINFGDKLNELTESLQSGLESPQAGDPESIKKLNEALDKINETVEKINELMKKMPQDLPEEFTNQQAIKEMDTGKIQDSANSIREALKNRDFGQALKQAQDMLKQMQKMLKTMQEASKEVGFGSADKKTSEQARKSMLELGEIIKEEGDILSETSAMENIRQEKISKEQEKILERLAQKQREAINTNNRAIGDCAAGGLPGFSGEQRYRLSENSGPMENVYRELSKKRIVKSKEWLKEILNRLNAASAAADGYSARVSTTQAEPWGQFSKIKSGTNRVKAMEQEILAELESEVNPEFSESEKNRMKNTAQKQLGLKGRALELDKSIQELSRQTAAVTPEISFNLRMASREMTNAQSFLEGSKSKEAMAAEQKALEYLTGSQDSMGGAEGSISMTQSKFNKPMAMPVRSRSSSSGGVMGVKSGEVKLPDVNDYLPPSEFREELIKGLKEKYPQAYDQQIKQYYKKLTQ